MTKAHQQALRHLAAIRNLREEEVLEQLTERAFERPDAFLDWSPGMSGNGKSALTPVPVDEESPNPTPTPV